MNLEKSKTEFLKIYFRKFHLFYCEIIANEISKKLCYFKHIYQFNPCNFDKISILNLLDTKNKNVIYKSKNSYIEDNSIIFLNGNLNHTLDIQKELDEIYSISKRCTRVVLVMYNPYFEFIYKFAKLIKIYKKDIPNNFVTKTNLINFLKISMFEEISYTNLIYCPFYLFGLEKIINNICRGIPIIKYLSFVSVSYIRPIKKSSPLTKLSIVVPARNEAGNIKNIFKEIHELSAKIPLELILVEGNSTDSTWEEIQKINLQYNNIMNVKILKQTGRGKANAVRIGFNNATGDLFTILDADLTVSSIHLEKFYYAYLNGLGDFINGNRLVYPMEKNAMKFLNRYGNIFFAKAISIVLGIKIGDSLCGTKLFSKVDYERFQLWRDNFGDFDPFGDFELIFPASELALGIVDLPIHYKNRSYGETNIQRFSDGFKLLKMVAIMFISKMKI